MTDAMERLLSLRVPDVMQRQVVTIGAHQTLDQAAAVLSHHGISGAPVVDAHGKCVGVLTATDFLRKEAGLGASPADHQLQRSSEARPLSIAPLGHELVSDYMTTAVQSVRPEISLMSAARVMCASHIHRLLVIDEHNCPVGVLTTLDVVAALINAVEESTTAWRST